MRKIILILFSIFFICFVSAYVTQNTDCSQEINPLLINLSILNQTNNNLSQELIYYKNLSEYYKELYENKEINITNKELITLNEQINNFNITINDIKKELSFLKLTLKVSIPIISVTLISLILFSFKLNKSKKEAKND
jgi:hypothetical protein